MSAFVSSWRELISRFTGVLVAGDAGPAHLLGETAADLSVLGSAFIVSPYLAFTARHVIDEFFQRYQGCDPAMADGHLDFGLDVGISHPEWGLIRWSVMGYGYSPTIDIVALVLAPNGLLPEKFSWTIPTLRVLPPNVDDSISCYAYPDSSYRVDQHAGGKVAINAHWSQGVVLDVHNPIRDRSSLNFPCLCTTLDIRGGMSGGPVFDNHGYVIGLCTTSFNLPAEEFHTPISYISLVWPAFGLELKESLDGDASPVEPYNLIKLVNAGLIRMHDAQSLRVNGNTITLQHPKI